MFKELGMWTMTMHYFLLLTKYLSPLGLPTVVRVETRTPNPCWPLTDKASKQKKKARTKS